MSERKIVMGIDTSNYTTSVALMYTDGELIANIKRPLPVKSGECGLRQSDAVFAHIKNIPSAMQEAKDYLNGKILSAIGVSVRPRNLEGSYMPCFLSGVASAESIASTLSVPLFEFSHQCGHIMAAAYSSGEEQLLDGREFCAFHVSGGTTEMLKVKFNGRSFDAELLGGTADLNAGQIIDRVGVKMGMRFPAGPYVEEAARQNKNKFLGRKPKCVDFEINLSGLENMADKMYLETGDAKLVSAFVIDYISNGLILLAESYERHFGRSKFLFAGGVMSNGIIKENLKKRFKAYFAEPSMSSDNAVGIAALTAKSFVNN